MCELLIIAAVFMVAVEIKCGELFNNARLSRKTTIGQLRQRADDIHCLPDCRSVGSDKSVSVFQCRECESEKAKEADATGNNPV